MLELILTLLVLGFIFLLFFVIKDGISITIVHKYQYDTPVIPPAAETIQTTKDIEEQNPVSLDTVVKGINEMLGVELDEK